MENGKWKMENDFSVDKQKWSSRRSRPKMQKNAQNRGCGRRRQIYIYVEAGMAKLKKHPKMQKNARNQGCGRRQKIYIYAEAGMAKLKKHPKMQKMRGIGVAIAGRKFISMQKQEWQS